MIKGHITVCKIYQDGTEEVVLNKSNMITGGLGSSFIDLQLGAGSMDAQDYCPRYFQIGTGSSVVNSSLTASAVFYQLSTPFDWVDYGDDNTLDIVQLRRGFNASTEDSGVTYGELLQTSTTFSSLVFSGIKGFFGTIGKDFNTRWFLDSCESEFVLDEDTANGKTISEIGLFAKNPKGLPNDNPVLMAYKSFTGLSKTKYFSLVIRWNIGFLGVCSKVDKYYGTNLLATGGSQPSVAVSPIGSYATKPPPLPPPPMGPSTGGGSSPGGGYY